MMKALLGLLGLREPPDQVLLLTGEGQHILREVEWFCGVPFATPNHVHNRCQLLPGGNVIGVDYVVGWLPASPLMKDFYDSERGAPDA